MSDFQFWLNLFVQVCVGAVLVLVIKHKNSLINTLKEQSNSAKAILELYDIQKLKDYQTLTNEVLELKHQKELDKAIKDAYVQFEQSAKDGFQKGAKDFAEKYNEFLDFQLHFLLDMDKNKRNEWLKSLPKNKEFIEMAINQIELGNVKAQ
tara:strand:- start:1821 stop:2273 length:453 start_codon:yes stop_codon:yes gene_type:complete